MNTETTDQARIDEMKEWIGTDCPFFTTIEQRVYTTGASRCVSGDYQVQITYPDGSQGWVNIEYLHI